MCVIKFNMIQKECEKCKKLINLSKDLYVLLGTYRGKKIIQVVYFHFNCWKLYFEEKTKNKAQAIVNGMQKKMIPIAKSFFEKIRN